MRSSGAERFVAKWLTYTGIRQPGLLERGLMVHLALATSRRSELTLWSVKKGTEGESCEERKAVKKAEAQSLCFVIADI